MSTTTRARPGKASPASTPEQRITKARSLVSAAKRKADRINSDMEVNRSTRQRNAFRVKADALDQVSDVLAGRA